MKKMATTGARRSLQRGADALVKEWCRGVLFGLLLICAALPIARAEDVSTVAASTLVKEMSSAHPPLILDVRSPEEYAQGHLPTALNIPHTAIEADRKSTRLNSSH